MKDQFTATSDRSLHVRTTIGGGLIFGLCLLLLAVAEFVSDQGDLGLRGGILCFGLFAAIVARYAAGFRRSAIPSQAAAGLAEVVNSRLGVAVFTIVLVLWSGTSYLSLSEGLRAFVLAGLGCWVVFSALRHRE